MTWPLNPLERKGNYSAASNNMKLIRCPLIGGARGDGTRQTIDARICYLRVKLTVLYSI